jgi:hypothetical protein
MKYLIQLMSSWNLTDSNGGNYSAFVHLKPDPWLVNITVFTLGSKEQHLKRILLTAHVTADPLLLASQMSGSCLSLTVQKWILSNLGSFKYCGVFTPCKNCNIETRSRDYAIVDEAVFSPCRAEQNRTEPWTSRSSRRIASPCCFQATAINTWITQE